MENTCVVVFGNTLEILGKYQGNTWVVVFGNTRDILGKYPGYTWVVVFGNTREILGKYPGNTWVVVFWASVAQLAEMWPEEPDDESRRLALPACRLSACFQPVQTWFQPVKSYLQPVKSWLQPVHPGFALPGFARGFSPRQLSLGGAAAADQSQKWPEEYFLYLQLKDINCRLKLV